MPLDSSNLPGKVKSKCNSLCAIIYDGSNGNCGLHTVRRRRGKDREHRAN